MHDEIGVDVNVHGIVQKDFMTMDLSVYAKCVYTLLRAYQGENSSCYPSLNKIAEDLKISKSTVIRSIKELEEINMIFVRRSKKHSKENNNNTYIALDLPNK